MLKRTVAELAAPGSVPSDPLDIVFQIMIPPFQPAADAPAVDDHHHRLPLAAAFAQVHVRFYVLLRVVGPIQPFQQSIQYSAISFTSYIFYSVLLNNTMKILFLYYNAFKIIAR